MSNKHSSITLEDASHLSVGDLIVSGEDIMKVTNYTSTVVSVKRLWFKSLILVIKNRIKKVFRILSEICHKINKPGIRNKQLS